MIPLSLPDIGEEELAAVREVLLSGWLTAGPKNEEFEAAFRTYAGVAHAVSMNSCTSALFLSVLAEGIRGEVILPSYTFVATANAVRTAGATPRFADVDYEDGMLTPASIEAAVTPRTEAVIVVHYAGQVADMAPIAALCRRRGLRLIEDSAETVGGTYHGKHPGAWGTACFSFFPTKNLTTGEGGMLTTNDAALAKRVRALLAHGIEKDLHEREKSAKPWVRSALVAGYNFRLPNFGAALGLIQLRRLDRMNERRRAIAARYDAGLGGLRLDLPVERMGRRHVYQMYCPKVRDGIDRDRIVEALRGRGVGASVHWEPAVHEMPAYADLRTTDLDLPVTAKIVDRVLTLPLYTTMTDAQVDEVIAACRAAVGEASSRARPAAKPAPAAPKKPPSRRRRAASKR